MLQLPAKDRPGQGIQPRIRFHGIPAWCTDRQELESPIPEFKHLAPNRSHHLPFTSERGPGGTPSVQCGNRFCSLLPPWIRTQTNAIWGVQWSKNGMGISVRTSANRLRGKRIHMSSERPESGRSVSPRFNGQPLELPPEGRSVSQALRPEQDRMNEPSARNR